MRVGSGSRAVVGAGGNDQVRRPPLPRGQGHKPEYHVPLYSPKAISFRPIGCTGALIF